MEQTLAHSTCMRDKCKMDGIKNNHDCNLPMVKNKSEKATDLKSSLREVVNPACTSFVMNFPKSESIMWPCWFLKIFWHSKNFVLLPSTRTPSILCYEFLSRTLVLYLFKLSFSIPWVELPLTYAYHFILLASTLTLCVSILPKSSRPSRSNYMLSLSLVPERVWEGIKPMMFVYSNDHDLFTYLMTVRTFMTNLKWRKKNSWVWWEVPVTNRSTLFLFITIMYIAGNTSTWELQSWFTLRNLLASFNDSRFRCWPRLFNLL